MVFDNLILYAHGVVKFFFNLAISIRGTVPRAYDNFNPSLTVPIVFNWYVYTAKA